MEEMITHILKITEHEIDDLIEHGQVTLSGVISDECINCCESFEIEIALKVDNK
jgi:hypothetical protein